MTPSSSKFDPDESGRLIRTSLSQVASLREIESFRWKLDWDKLGHVLDSVEANLSLARGRLEYAHFLEGSLSSDPAAPEQMAQSEASAHLASARFRRAAELFRRLGDVPGEAESLFWIGTYDQVVAKNEVAAVASLSRAQELASGVNDGLILSCVARHLAFHAMSEDRDDEARLFLEQSVHLRRELDFPEGVAAALVALAEFEASRDGTQAMLRLLDEAETIARAQGAGELLQLVGRTRKALESGRPPP